VPAVEAGALLVRFPAAIGLATLNRMTKLGAEPWTHVPSGTTLEVATRPLKGGNESLGGPGFSRFRGTIDDEGGERVWRITEAFPRVSGDVLRHALALSAAAESDHRLVLADVAEAERVYALLAEGGQIFMKMEQTFFAERFAMLRDRFGTSWMLLQGGLTLAQQRKR